MTPIEAQRASNPLLGELAVRQGMLDQAQARRIQQRQRVEDRRFGDIDTFLAKGLGLSATTIAALRDRLRDG